MPNEDHIEGLEGQWVKAVALKREALKQEALHERNGKVMLGDRRHSFGHCQENGA